MLWDSIYPTWGRWLLDDERTGDLENLIRRLGLLECFRRRLGARDQVQVGGVASLNRDDRAGGGDEVHVGQVLAGAIVGGDTGVLEGSRRGQEAGRVRHAKVVRRF